MKNLSSLRKLNNLTMKELGNQLHLSESTISLYESGKREPDFATLKRLANYFNVSIDYLLGYEKSTSTKFIETKNRLALSLAKKNIRVEDLEKLSPDDIDILLSLIEKFLKEKK